MRNVQGRIPGKNIYSLTFNSLLLGVMIHIHDTDLFFLLNSFFFFRFFDAYTNGNLYLCGDLVRLFALCPMTGHRLKSDPSTNQAPRILRQLSTDARIEAEIRNLATQVINCACYNISIRIIRTIPCFALRAQISPLFIFDSSFFSNSNSCGEL